MVGKSLTLDGRAYPIVGVIEPGFAERQPGEALGFLARPAGPQVALDLALPVETQLVVQLALDGAAPQERTAAPRRAAED
ncbi:MAG TPA: hypothetical protein VJA16_14295 [Thermoanaerobaculia bacterium]